MSEPRADDVPQSEHSALVGEYVRRLTEFQQNALRECGIDVAALLAVADERAKLRAENALLTERLAVAHKMISYMDPI